MKNWKVELIARGKTLVEVKIHRGIFCGDALSPLLFVIEMTSLNYIVKKCTGSYKFTRSLENVYERHQAVCKKKKKKKNEKDLETLI